MFGSLFLEVNHLKNWELETLEQILSVWSDIAGTSGNQTWQWKIHYLCDFPIETPISSGFPSARFDYRRVIKHKNHRWFSSHDHEISRVLALTSTAPWNHASWGGSEAQKALEIKTSQTVNPTIYPCACSITPILNHVHSSHHFRPASIFSWRQNASPPKKCLCTNAHACVRTKNAHKYVYIYIHIIMDWLRGQLTGNHDFTPKYWLVLCNFPFNPIWELKEHNVGSWLVPRVPMVAIFPNYSETHVLFGGFTFVAKQNWESLKKKNVIAEGHFFFSKTL